MKKILIILIVLFSLSSSASAENVITDQYVTEEGIQINSYSTNWQGQKLKDIHDELISNTHGEELSSLKTINLYPGANGDGKEEGMYHFSIRKANLFSGGTKLQDGSTIDLYNMDSKKSVDEIARVLAHEYGHHFTIYYMAKHDSKYFTDWKESGYYQTRLGKEFPLIAEDESNGHQWNLAEIAAEDYVQLYGSPKSKGAVEVYDILERFQKGLLDNKLEYSSLSYNITPQENMEIPLALEIPAVRDYWEKLSEVSSDARAYSKPELEFDSATKLGDGYSQYLFKWSDSRDASGVEASYYTLVAYSSDLKNYTPIKLVGADEENEAVIGSVVQNTSRSRRYYSDGIPGGGYNKLKLIAVGKNGEAVASSLYEVNYENNSMTEFKSNYASDSIPAVENLTKDESIFTRVSYVVSEIFYIIYSIYEMIFLHISINQ
ncbi:MAG: hypothetical protein HGA49_09180 [Eubacteriaceae bacterium]|nr:hypothetical protein [Eubacteriaceae bacterium]